MSLEIQLLRDEIKQLAKKINCLERKCSSSSIATKYLRPFKTYEDALAAGIFKNMEFKAAIGNKINAAPGTRIVQVLSS